MKHLLAAACRVFVPLVFLFLATDCSVSKRHYMKGYHVEWKKKSLPAVVNRSATQRHHHKEAAPDPPGPTMTAAPVPDVYAGAGHMPQLIASRKKLVAAVPPDSCKDEILMRNGDVIKARIEEVNGAEVRYRRCENLEGPLYTTSISNIFSVTYANGLKRVFPRPASAAGAAAPAYTGPRKLNGWALASFISAILGILIIPLIFAFVFGIVGYQQIKKQPQRYKGKWMAIVGIVMGSLAVLGLVLLLVLVALWI